MIQFSVRGMSCAACSSRVEKAVSNVEGVTSCSVNLLTNSMNVEGTASEKDIIDAVTKAGYKASVKGVNSDSLDGDTNKIKSDSCNRTTRINSEYEDIEKVANEEMSNIKSRIISSLVFLIPLMYISMGAMMWGWPLPRFLEHNYVGIGLSQLILTTIVLVINQKFFTNGYKSLWNKAPNMDTLVALGSSAAYIYSIAMLFLLVKAQMKHDDVLMHKYMHEFYFESAAMILTLISVGKMLEARTKGKTTNAIKGLMKLAPKVATVIRNNNEVEIDINDVVVGDIFVVRPGENMPVDGFIIEGSTSVDESALTGESIPVDKSEGSTVSAATINKEGFIKCKAIRVGEDTTLSQIIKVVSDAVATKAPIAKVADIVSGVFVPIVIILALITMSIWLLAGESLGFALARGISVLVISCPCALGLATPVAIMVGSGVGAKYGIMFKNAVALEQTGKANIVVLDKTGTITKGMPVVTNIIVSNDDESVYKKLITVAYSLESKSEHPLSKAITEYVDNLNSVDKSLGNGLNISDFKTIPGKGVVGSYNGVMVSGGNYNYIATQCNIPEAIKEQANSMAIEGKTPLYFQENGNLLGIIVVADIIKEDSKLAIKELKNMGIRVVMLTGDNENTAKAIAREACVDDIVAGVLPEEKANIIVDLQNGLYDKKNKVNKKKSCVIMVGDGINDAPALVKADVGIAIGAGTDIAIESADVVLMKSRLSDVVGAIRLSKKTLKNIHENLFWAFIYNVIGIPLAAGALIPLFKLELNPMFGALAMSLSSFCVVSNALRLNFTKLYSKEYKNYMESDLKSENQDSDIMNKKIQYIKCINNDKINTIKELDNMEKVMKIEGMMCGHCEARVKKVLEGLEGVTEAIVSHEKDEAIVIMDKEISNDILKNIIEEQDYKVLEIK